MATNLTRLRLRARGSGAKQQIKGGKRGESRYLSAESCTHSAAGKSGSDSHRPKPSTMARDPGRPRRPRGLQTARRGSARRAARERARRGIGMRALCGFGARFWRGEFVWLVPLLAVPWRLLSSWLVPLSGAFPLLGWWFTNRLCAPGYLLSCKMAVCSRLKFLVKTLHALKMDKNKD